MKRLGLRHDAYRIGGTPKATAALASRMYRGGGAFPVSHRWKPGREHPRALAASACERPRRLRHERSAWDAVHGHVASITCTSGRRP